jgi:hypothetical protein
MAMQNRSSRQWPSLTPSARKQAQIAHLNYLTGVADEAIEARRNGKKLGAGKAKVNSDIRGRPGPPRLAIHAGAVICPLDHSGRATPPARPLFLVFARNSLIVTGYALARRLVVPCAVGVLQARAAPCCLAARGACQLRRCRYRQLRGVAPSPLRRQLRHRRVLGGGVWGAAACGTCWDGSTSILRPVAPAFPAAIASAILAATIAVPDTGMYHCQRHWDRDSVARDGLLNAATMLFGPADVRHSPL